MKVLKAIRILGDVAEIIVWASIVIELVERYRAKKKTPAPVLIDPANTPIEEKAIDDIVAMKMDVLPRGGRKKDFWDLHLLHNHYTIEQMLSLYE